MRHPHIKICGLKTTDAIDAVIARGGPEVGFVHFGKSPRHLSLDSMAGLRDHVADRAAVTIVTVDADDATLEQIAHRVRPDTIQLHGHETPERVAAVKSLTGLPVMKAISIRSAADLDTLAAFQPVADRLLLDAKAPEGAALPGGNGVAFDWTLLHALGPDIAYMLSGGLNAVNVGRALAMLAPYGLDVSSGVESAPGVKDIARIHQFFDAVDTALQTREQKQAS